MSHWSEETACSVLSELAESANITDVARRRGWAPKLIFTWMHQSQQHENDGKTDSKYLIAWPLDDLGQGEVRFFHRAVQVALRMFASTIDLEHRSNIRGYKKPLLDPRTNMPIYEVDDVLIAKYGGFDERAKKEAEIDGVFDFPYKHDETGARIRVYTTERMPALLHQRALESIQPSTYAPPAQKVELDHQVRGVMVFGHNTPVRPQTELVQSLEQQLQRIRNGETNPRPEGHVQVFSADDVAIDDAAKLKPQTIEDHPRAYRAPRPAPKLLPPSAPAYARSESTERPADSSGIGYGKPHSGGFRVS